jgi:type I restriction enzyme M protein
MLFLCHAISKMKPQTEGGSRIAIIHNGSPLFTGDAGSGPSEIRRHILENDLLEAIIQLPNDIFYNTGITTYLWVLSSHKSDLRRGKVQLIDASKAFVKLRKSLGKKRNEISDEQISEITKVYGEFEEGIFNKQSFEIESKIFDSAEFGFKKITLENPKKDEKGNLVLDKKDQRQADSEQRDTENVPLNIDIQEYFEKNVKPYYPEAWIDEKKTKVGYEIPFTRYFYKYTPPRKSDDIFSEIKDLEKEETRLMKELFEK